jgi:nitrogen fixation protein NifU and related proteins
MSGGIYRGNVLEHAIYPRNRGTLDPADFSYEDAGSVCGDEVRIDVRVKDGYVDAVAFSGRGCAVSQASASVLTELILQMGIEEVKALSEDTLLAAIGVPLGPARTECALLSLTVLRAAVSAPVP